MCQLAVAAEVIQTQRVRNLLVITAVLVASSCRGCDEAPPFDAAVFLTDEAIEAYGGEVCDDSIGIVAPLPTCYPDRVCERVLPIVGRRDPIATPTHIPDCETDAEEDGHGPWSDAPAITFTDRDNLRRRYCMRGSDAAEPMPLVLWYHGSGGSADDVYTFTKLPQRAKDYDLGGPQPGFVLVSIEGRNLHWPTDDPRDGPHHDVFHRDLDADSDNRDVSMADYLIDQLVTQGIADPNRIYVMGWSNGMHFAQMYGIARHEIPTAGGNRVAAVAGYSAADPFHNRAHDQDPSCQLRDYPRSEVPILLVGRDCDAIACSDAQYERSIEKDRPVAPGTSVETWMRTLAERVGNPNAERIIVDRDGQRVSSCRDASSCRARRALINHIRWPDGVNDKGGSDWEPTMLSFLREHPL